MRRIVAFMVMDFLASCAIFAVPKLQRNFVWDAGRAAKLLDRIYREMQIYGYSDCHMSSNYG